MLNEEFRYEISKKKKTFLKQPRIVVSFVNSL